MRLMGWLPLLVGIPLLFLFAVGLIPIIVGFILVHFANQKAQTSVTKQSLRPLLKPLRAWP